MKNLKEYLLFALLFLFIFFNLYSNSFAQCPAYNDLLNQGWLFVPNTNHLATTGNNEDEFGVIDTSPFFIKVNNYPPIRAFPKTYNDCTPEDIYYMSFDTDGQYQPIPFDVPFHNSNIVNIFREDGTGYTASVRPPTNLDVSASADFIMNFNTTEYDMAWDPYDPNHPNSINWEWNDFVTNAAPQSFTFHGVIEGLNELNGGQSAEYIANIYGGNGNYGFKWEYSNDQGNTWILAKDNPHAIDWIYFNITDRYYYYQNEYKLNITMQTNSITLKCTVTDSNYYQGIYNTIVLYKTINPAPVQITFINEIENTTNFGELILDEDKEVPLQSGVPKSLNYSQVDHYIRTNELPFIFNYNNTGKTEKHLLWNFATPLNLLNYRFQVNLNVLREMRSKFISTDPATFRNLLESVETPGSILHFKDPWYYYHDSYYNWFQSDEFKQYSSPLNLLNNSTSSYGGVFLNQPYTGTNPFYSVKVDLEQTISLTGGDHKFYFQNWSYDPAKISLQYPSSNQTGVVFKATDATLTANLKGQLVSSESYGFSSNGQRKIVRDNSGYYHCVYSSLGKVWYTKSTTTDFSGSWTQDVDVFSNISQNAKNPSIDFYNNHIAIVAEYWDGSSAAIGLYRSDNTPSLEYIANIDASYYGSSYPVVSRTNEEIFILYKTSATSQLKYRRCYLNTSGIWIWEVEATLSASTSNSKNSAIVGEKVNDKLYITWQEGTLAIKYIYSPVPTNYYLRTFDPVETVTTNSGYSTHSNPSISLINNTQPIISWTGARKESVLNKINGTQALVWVNRAMIRVKGSSWGDFTAVSSDVNFTNNNSSSSSTGETVITFSQNGGQSAKWLKRVGGYYSEINPLSHNGLLVNVSNGSSIVNQKALVFNTTTLPYPINRSTTAFNNLAKIASDTIITYGRTGIISKEGVEFVFCAEDILLDDENIKFIERVDTLPILNLIELNTAAKTNDFYLTGSSNLFFSLYYLVINPELATSILSDEDYFNFKLELVNASTNQVVGTFDNVTYTKQNVYDYENINYKVDCSGISSGNYYLRIVATANDYSGLAISNNQNDAGMLGKTQYTEINYTGNTIPIEYALAQNFPNPFNPSTTIRYQLPKDGIITLKIYDILGSEVATLVNEEKVAGKYEVNFNASSFASGVYIYKIQAGSFVNSKKMILLK